MIERFSRKWWKVGVVLAALWGGLHLLLRSRPLVKPVAISHRGAAGSVAENTLASIERAIELGAEYIEVDVQRTADNVLVLLHDRTINRTTKGRGSLRLLNWDAVQAASEERPIPMLEAVLTLIKMAGVTLVLELKHPQLYPGIEAQTLALIEKFGMADQVIVVSFNLDSLERVSQLKPDIETGQLYIFGFYMPNGKGSSLVEVFWPVPLIDPSFVWRQHRNGRRVWIWTVDNRWLMQLLLWLGVDGITTNYPERWPN